VNALGSFLLFTLPPFQPDKLAIDNWQTSPRMARSLVLGGLRTTGAQPDHFD
jgi:hypothetical protein